MCRQAYREQLAEYQQQMRPLLEVVTEDQSGAGGSAPADEDRPADDYPRPRVWNARDLETARQVDWLAASRLPAAAVSYMLGPEGIGKSLWTVWLVSVLTTGKPFPAFGIPARDPSVVVLVLTEDDWATVARPRLEVAGADLDHVRVICAERDGSGAPIFPTDMPVVHAATQDAALVVVDAWADTLPSTLSVKDPQQARRALHPWKELATRTGVAVLLTGHTNREKGGNVRNAYGMSGEIRKKARMTILAQPDPDEDGVLVIGPEKTNLTAPVSASRFRIESVRMFDPTDASDGTVPRLVWIGDAEHSARDFFADAAAAENGDGADDRNEIDEWLTEFLSHGSVKATDVFQAADANGFSKDQVKRAKRRINAKAERPQNPGPWFWSLPAFTTETGSREQ
ncbi:AAA family ATPase [Nocardia puris]|uniref:AAA family ATPase n=1 Tax=Nocardia puris TaxID=208602 RepID=UPI001894C706|nr:AAA family ATPase [Nocardia puris]MBF6213823.1 AAA family ATPase [Nocardia puris]